MVQNRRTYLWYDLAFLSPLFELEHRHPISLGYLGQRVRSTSHVGDREHRHNLVPLSTKQLVDLKE